VGLDQVAPVALRVPATLRTPQRDDHAERGSLVGQAIALRGPEGLLPLVVPQIDQVVARSALDDVADEQPAAVVAALV